ncbi:hypothetical protein [Synechococcus phage S-N03]|uniref:Uncharacterized protein n=1 Tax=Synechococcus phage S-N03 TaxID=2718943 RepID=A0A6G8R5Z5_9CAUD|nr:hypothetical protein PQC09_gp242 [Synechococcus phage S-N03]QIN96825.1 hypothetical protein [Synechococcus phage S-N03]
MCGGDTPPNQPFRVRLAPVRGYSLFRFAMKLFLARARWGDELTAKDYALINEMSLLEVFASSYILPKTARVRTSSVLRRR